MIWIVIVAALIIIGALSFYAGSLLAQLRRQRRQIKEAVSKRNSNLFESIYTIGLAMQQGQCDLSEGALRIAVLLDHLGDYEQVDFQAKYPGIHDMYERIKHMPTHDARKQYPRKEIQRLDAEREGYEKELEEPIQADLETLLPWIREQRAGS